MYAKGAGFWKIGWITTVGRRIGQCGVERPDTAAASRLAGPSSQQLLKMGGGLAVDGVLGMDVDFHGDLAGRVAKAGLHLLDVLVGRAKRGAAGVPPRMHRVDLAAPVGLVVLTMAALAIRHIVGDRIEVGLLGQ